MNNERKNIDNLFRDVLFDYQEPLSPKAWNKVKHKLHAIKQKRQRRIVGALAAAVLLLITFFGGYYMAKYRYMPQSFKATNQTNKNSQSYDIATDSTRHIPQKNSNPIKKTLQFERNQKQGDKKYNLQKDKLITETLPKNNSGRILVTDEKPRQQTKIQTNLPLLPTADSLLTGYSQTGIVTKPHKLDKSPALHPVSGRIKTRMSTFLQIDSTKASQIKSETNIIVPCERRMTIGFKFSPMYNYRRTMDNHSEASVDVGSHAYAEALSDKAFYDMVERSMVTYSFGISFEYIMNRRLTLETGLRYSRIGLETHNVYIITRTSKNESSIFTSLGNIITAPYFDGKPPYNTPRFAAPGYPTYFDLIQYFDYIEVPVLVKGSIIRKKPLHFYLFGGISLSRLVGNQSYLMDNEAQISIGQTNDIKKDNYRAIGGIGAEYKFHEAFSIYIEPVVNYSLTPVNINSSVFSYPYSFGAYTGIKYSF